MREQEEFIRSAAIGEAITIIALALLHKELNVGQVITFWFAIHMISTWTVDWTFDTIKKCRDAWHSRHGKTR